MANEFKLTPSLIYENGSLKRTFAPGTLQFPQSIKGICEQTISATTAEADVTYLGINTPSFHIIQSLESTTTGNTWNWGLKSSTGGIPQYFQLKPKQMAIVTLGTSAMVIRGKMSLGTAKIHVMSFEN